MFENLGSNTSPVIQQMVEADNDHIIIYRPAYWPMCEPIEYVFCQLADQLYDRYHAIRDLPQLVNTINCIIGQLCDFDATFDHIGYTSNQ